MTHGVERVALRVEGELLVLTYEVFVELPKGDIIGLELLRDELVQATFGVEVVGRCGFSTVYANPSQLTLVEHLKTLQEHHLCRNATLHEALHVICAKGSVALREVIISLVD